VLDIMRWQCIDDWY